MIRAFIGLALIFVAGSVCASEPLPWQMGFQPAATPIMQEIEHLHHFLMIIMGGVVVVVLGLLIYVCLRFNAKANPIPNKFSHNVVIEIIWTVVPAILLVIIAIPSFRTLSFAETMPPVDLTIKVVGKQWYWTYSYPDNGAFEFDSYLIPQEKLLPGQKRLLDVDNRMVIPAGKVVRFLITAADVIHSFGVPAFGLKTDAIPGRVNEAWIKVDKPGVYYGQCSELCGVNHGFMPIAIEVVSNEEFDAWVTTSKQKFASNDNTMHLASNP
ncbi:MAG: cytochrome c oxidase subunit II [Pseudomonadota bacterium]